jgi:predicted P-loop ATPase
MKPGCKFDSVLTLVGRQGIGKSTLLSRLGGSWYNENVTLFNISKDTADMLQGSWIIELGELVGFRKAEVESVKNFISRTEDRYRKAYGRNTDIFPRQCVFFGTTNEPVFLRDPTGNRRWWPVETGVNLPCRDIFSELTPNEVAQIWAEAKEIYEAGEALYLERDVYDAAQKVQSQFSEYNEKAGMIEKYLELDIPENWEQMSLYERREYLVAKPNDTRYRDAETVRRDKVCIPEIWCELFCGDLKSLRKMDSNEIANCLRQIDGWMENKNPMRFGGYGRQKGFYRVIRNA